MQRLTMNATTLLLLLAVVLACTAEFVLSKSQLGAMEHKGSTGVSGGEVAAVEDVRAFLFFATLEGLYRDGISSDDVDQILRKDASGYVHFVYGCPVCMPVLNALRAYNERPTFYGSKRARDTFGEGLDPSLQKRLRSSVPKERLDVIHTLLARWVKGRFEKLLLTAEQRRELENGIAMGVKKGSGVVEALRESGRAGIFAGGSACAVCEGAQSGAQEAK